MFTDPDLSYFAGFFDGEGSVGIYASGQHDCGKPRYRLTVSVGQSGFNVPKILKLFEATFGGSINEGKSGMANGQRAWQWRVSAVTANEFLLAILPYVVVKRKQVELALEFQRLIFEATSLPRRGQSAINGVRKMELIELRKDCYERMKGLKHA